MKKKTILFAVQLPPPIHGSSIINELIVSNKKINESFQVEVLPIQMATNMEDMGQFSYKKLYNTVMIILKQIYMLSTKKIDLYYIALSPIHFAFYKDFILVSIAKIFNKKITVHLHGQGIKNEASQSRIKRRMYKHVFKNTQVICLAEPLHDDIKDLYSGSPHFLANGIKREKDIVYTDKSTTFLYLSNLKIEKGIEVFLEALLQLKQKGYSFKADIIGSSSNYTNEEAQNYVNDNDLKDFVEVLGPKFGPEKYDYLARSKVFVLPSFQECFPLTILEAYQSKAAVISTETGGIPEIITNGENGFVVTPNDVNELVDKMELFLKDENLHIRMGEINFAKFEENYTQNLFISNLIKILEGNL